jgi:putative transposase
VVRNGKARRRRVTVGSGTVEMVAPRVNDRRVDVEGERKRFTSAILPPYMRRSPKVAEVLPILYLRGLSTGDFRQALQALLGEDAAGLSARPDGSKELIAVEDGFRESTDSWATVLRDLKSRGMRAPELAIGDGALGFWAAVRDVYGRRRASSGTGCTGSRTCWTSRRSGCSRRPRRRSMTS